MHTNWHDSDTSWFPPPLPAAAPQPPADFWRVAPSDPALDFNRLPASPPPLAADRGAGKHPAWRSGWHLRIPVQARWAAIGFAAGAIFWHFVGFWTVMSQIMFASPDAARPVAGVAPQRASPVPAMTPPIETGSLQRLEKLTAAKPASASEPFCTAITLDPHSQTLLQSNCKRLAHSLPHKGALPRQDRDVSAAAAAGPVMPQPRAVTATAAAADIQLDPSAPLEWPAASGRR